LQTLEALNFGSPLTIIFCLVVGGFLILDLGFFSKKDHEIKFKEALLWSAFWAALAFAFAGGVWWQKGSSQALLFVTGYLVELSLSVDNLFVFLLVFSAFRIPGKYQHRVLFWGIIGALVLRAVCIGLGVVALKKFEWIVYIFAVILIYAGIKTLKTNHEDDDPSKGLIVRLIRKFIPVTDKIHDSNFFVKIAGQWTATPLFLALVTIEISDLVFAIDSIPAVLAVSDDAFIVYTSNIFAILGLRSLYFALAHLMNLFAYLKYALSVILVFVGVKIGLSHHFKIPPEVALGVIIGLLAIAILASVVKPPKTPEHSAKS
jgi:tellurite resistance protein TerC